MPFAKRTVPNPKHRLAAKPDPAALDRLAQSVRYGGNGEHKRNRGDFNLQPPFGPRRGKTLCDGASVHTRSQALGLLQAGIRRGLVSEQVRNDFPQNVWAVTADGIPLEAQLENSETGAYHGYPMQEADPFRAKILARWEEAGE